MLEERKKITFDQFIRTTIVILGIVAALMLINRLTSVLLPFFVAWVIAYMIYPIVKFFQHKVRLKSRPLAIFVTLLSISIIGAALSYFLIPPLIIEMGRVKDLLMDYLQSGGDQGTHIPQNLSAFIKEYVDLKSISEVFEHDKLLDMLQQALPKVWTILSESVSFLINIFTFFLILLYIVFILLDYESIAEGWIGYLPEKYRTFSQSLVNEVQDGMNRYFRGQALVALCVGILMSIGFLIIDFPLAIGLGLLIGALNMVPYLQILGFVPTILLAILKASDTGSNFWVIIGSALAVFAIVQIIQDGFIVPRIMGKITGLNPAIILLSLSIWGSLMGLIGLIIALPLTTLLLSYYQRFIINRENIFQQNKIPDNTDTQK
ncbi:AI-2E family transporter [Bacteroides propionicifaciens]|uniref:AI-2E family transporter n=1 Tax=Bacteroides propionicifaciens TaxID=392838 RepID=UPI000366739A|nr:AI-2E family transporter [Bacteroides propionicifaciens]